MREAGAAAPLRGLGARGGRPAAFSNPGRNRGESRRSKKPLFGECAERKGEQEARQGPLMVGKKPERPASKRMISRRPARGTTKHNYEQPSTGKNTVRLLRARVRARGCGGAARRCVFSRSARATAGPPGGGADKGYGSFPPGPFLHPLRRQKRPRAGGHLLEGGR